MRRFPGKGSDLNPLSRFDLVQREKAEFEKERRKISVREDTSRTILTRNNSPDIPFSVSINPYRGCDHGCVYCYARPTHNYLDLSAGTDFETILFAKRSAAALLRQEWQKRNYAVSPIALSGITDCYQTIEEKEQITRSVLSLMEEYNHPVTVLTKSSLVTRDIPILKKLASKNLVSVSISLSSLDPSLTARLEPRASTPRARLSAMEELSSAGIPTGIMTAPLIPFLNDNELESVLKAAKQAGARFAGFNILRLPHEVKEIFADFLEREFPLHKDRVLQKIIEIQGESQDGAGEFFARMTGQGEYARMLAQRFRIATNKLGYTSFPELDVRAFTPPGKSLNLFS